MQLLVTDYSCTYSSGVGSVLVEWLLFLDGVLTLVKVSDNRLRQGTVRENVD